MYIIVRKLLLCIVFSCTAAHAFAQTPSDFGIPVKVIANNGETPSVTLSWPANADAIAYTIRRKQVNDSSYKDYFSDLAVIPNTGGDVTKFTDNAIDTAVLYEYEIKSSYLTSLPSVKITYICAGINLPATHKRGSILLLCESNLASEAAANLKQLYADLVGDGWKVIRLDVNNTGSPSDPVQVKNKILNTYSTYPDLKQVLIVGHVPVPYSGNIGPDGHTNHIGAWPADGYYGALGGRWTDTITSSFVASTRNETKNLPGDGKFDQDSLPTVQLAVGRIDFSNLPVFGIGENDLLNRYLAKNHSFRHAQISVQKRALVEDNLTSFTEKFSQSAWKSFTATVGYDNIFSGQYESWLLWPDGFLWSYGCGGGTYTGAGGIGNSSDFATQSYNTVFTQLFGSYFGDWDSQDNYMRCSIASAGNTLACVWGGRPHWYFHHMSSGMPIGYSTLLAMNNRGQYLNLGANNANVHIALMGDPTLRESYIKPPPIFLSEANGRKIELQWARSIEDNVTGYFLYRSNSVAGNFTLLNQQPITALSYIDSTPLNGNNVYMIRAAKMDTIINSGTYTNNSTYLNLSQGLFDSAFVILPNVPVVSLEQIATATEPVQVAVLGTNDKQYFVAQKNGEIKLFDNSLNFVKTYLSIPVSNEGLFSVAFDPAFASNRLLYAFYTNEAGDIELSRFRKDENIDTALFDGVMFTIPNPGESANKGGEINFGSDGSLFISTGDGDTREVNAGNAQNTQSNLGKILRIIPAPATAPAYMYSIPPDNPYGNEVYLLGLRFPYRWGFDKSTKDIWIADRGDSSVEEVNLLAFGSINNANLGWPCYEGSNVFHPDGCGPAENYRFPVYQYPSPGSGGSITGGTVYNGETYITLKGFYISADASDSSISLVKYDPDLQAYTFSHQQLLPGAISDISEDADGELYATSLHGGIYRITANGSRSYKFTGNGNWDNPDNWSNKTIPPASLPAGSAIFISPVAGGKCVLNIPQTISAGSSITVANGRAFTILGDLIVQ